MNKSINYPINLNNTMKRIHSFLLLSFTFSFLPFGAQAQESKEEDKTYELTPFTIEEGSESGYYASQTLAGGRIKQSLKDTGAAVQVVTAEFMEDIGATDIEELLQYTTSSEVAGILGNFTGAEDQDAGAIGTGAARRDPDGTSRIRGIAAPDRTRNFFVTDIPFNTYNTQRVDINRGANSFLFGLGSPAGLLNNALSKARFVNSGQVRIRMSSGESHNFFKDNPSTQLSINLNRILIEDKLAFHVAALQDNAIYRQRPTYKDDDRVYGAMTFQPFGDSRTVIRAHFETGEIIGNAPDVLLPQENLTTFLETPAVFDSIYTGRKGRSWNQEGAHPKNKKFGYPSLTDEEKAQAAAEGFWWPRDQQGLLRYRNIRWGGGAYGFIFDGRNGRDATMAYTDQYPGLVFQRKHNKKNPVNNFFNFAGTDGKRFNGAAQGIYPGNKGEILGSGWLDQGFLDLDTFDFSRNNLGWDNDFYTREFFNYNVSLEQTLWEGKAGFEIVYNFEDIFRDSYTALNGGNSVVTLDTNRNLLLPADPNYLESGNYDPMPNPNFGRPVIMTKAGRRSNDDIRESFRLTAFFKHDFADQFEDGLGSKLGNHTLTLLADTYTHDEMVVNYNYNAFGNPNPAQHIGPANARQASNNARNTPNLVYVGPQQLDMFGGHAGGFKLSDFTLSPANYDIRGTKDRNFQKLSWNLGPDATPEALAADVGNYRKNGNEQFLWHEYTPKEVPNKNHRKQETVVESLAINSQSKFFNNNLVINLGYREDKVENWLNTEAPIIGLDEISDMSEEAWIPENGTFTLTEENIFGYGGVLYIPQNMLPFKDVVNDITFHYNTTDNFIPQTERVDQYRLPVTSPTGNSEDWGISAYLYDNKVVARLNWFKSHMMNATTDLSGTFNRSMVRIFQWWGRINRNLQQFAEVDDQGNWTIKPEVAAEEIEIDPETGLSEDGLTFEDAVAERWPYIQDAADGRAAFLPYINDPLLQHAFNVRFLPDGDVNIQWAGQITDTNDVYAEGMEAEIILNPTENWRIAFNAAEQKVVRENIAPRLTALTYDLWLPYLAEFGHLDWSAPLETESGGSINDQVGDRLVEYFYQKGLEGIPTPEVRQWRFNFVTNYQFREGFLKGFSIGGAARWQDKISGGYPISIAPFSDYGIDSSRVSNWNPTGGVVEPDPFNPYFTEPELSLDAMFGYRKKIGNIDWRTQINIRNLQNWNSDEIYFLRFQPDGSPARARFQPPRTIMWTNTFRF
tara:strand:+ start:306 stop:4037 length:3732 start_codon:yes stop_codon:yes gene_type:complete